MLFVEFVHLSGICSALYSLNATCVYLLKTPVDLIGSSTLMKEMLQGRTEMFNMNAFTEVLYKKKKTIIE